MHYGFALAVNRGVEQADADSDLLVLHHDAVPASGVSGVLQNIVYAEGNVPCDVSLSYYHDNVEPLTLFHNGETVELNFAPFCCVYIKREIWDSCGGLDTRDEGHYRPERIMCDYIRRILRKKIVYTPEAVVFFCPKDKIPGHS